MYINVDNDVSNETNMPPRVNSDHVLDTQGKRVLELCQSTSFVIGNGRLHNDLGIGDFTFHSFNGSSTVDYFLLNPDDFKHVTGFSILDTNEFSDHCAIEFMVA